MVLAALAFDLQGLVGRLFDRFFETLLIADEVDDSPLLVERQGLPFVGADQHAAIASGIADDNADRLYHHACPIWVGFELFEPEAKSALVAIGGFGAGDPFESEFVDMLLHWFLIGRGEDPELKKGIA